MKSAKYEVVGTRKTGYAVVLQNGAIEYDLLETRKLAYAIRDVLNEGIGPEWDIVEAELDRRKIAH